jgi:DNA-directed RNA polymerase specialized sigma24 family protein
MNNKTHKEIERLLPEIKRTVASTLRGTPYHSEDDIDECFSTVVLEAVDYGARTFDPSKGSAKSHFTCFASRRAKNWLRATSKRRGTFSLSSGSESEDDVTLNVASPACDPLLSLIRQEDGDALMAIVQKFDQRSKDLLLAFMRHGSWSAAASEVGVSIATASRVKTRMMRRLGFEG